MHQSDKRILPDDNGLILSENLQQLARVLDKLLIGVQLLNNPLKLSLRCFNGREIDTLICSIIDFFLYVAGILAISITERFSNMLILYT